MTTAGIQRRIDALGSAGGVVQLSPGDYSISETIVVSSNITLRGDRNGRTRIKLLDGLRAKPLITTIDRNVVLSDLQLYANGLKQSQPHNPEDADDPDWPDVSTGSAVMVQSHSSRIVRLFVRDAWDNGIMVKEFPGFDLSKRWQIKGGPRNVAIDRCLTVSCGIGPRVFTYPPSSPRGETKGAGINVGTATEVVVSNCFDIGSSTGFTCEYGGDAEATFRECYTYLARQRTQGDYYGTGIGFWIASTTSLESCRSVESDSYGFVVDGHAPANSVQLRSCVAVKPGRDGYRIDPNVRAKKINCKVDRRPSRTQVCRILPNPAMLDDTTESKVIAAAGNKLYMVKNGDQIWRVLPSLKQIHSTDQPLTIAAAGNKLYMVKNGNQIWCVLPSLKQIHSTDQPLTIAAAGNNLYMVKNGDQIWRVLPSLKQIHSTDQPLTIAAAGNNLYMVKNGDQIWRVLPSLKQIHSTDQPLTIAAAGNNLYMVKNGDQIWRVLPTLKHLFDFPKSLSVACGDEALYVSQTY